MFFSERFFFQINCKTASKGCCADLARLSRPPDISAAVAVLMFRTEAEPAERT